MENSRNTYPDFVIKDIQHVIKREASSSWNFRDITHSQHYVLALVINGECLYQFDHKEYNAVEGDIVFFQKNLKHSVQSSSQKPWSFISTTFNVEFKEGGEDGIGTVLDGLSNIFKPRDFSQMSALFSELNYIWSGMRPYHLLKCRSLITDILYTILNQKMMEGYVNPHSHSIKKVLDIILKNYSKNYSVEELARSADLSYSHFSLLFKEMTGFGVTEYQNQVKVNKAKDFLLSGECNVTEAAHIVGFSNIYYFSRLFKRITGINPSEYLKMQ